MKLKHYLIFSIVLIIFSSGTAAGGYFYGTLTAKKKAELDKEAAVKGAIYDAQEKLNKEAIEKAKEVVGEVNDKNSFEASKAVKEFFSKVEGSDLEGAYALLSTDYKKTLYSKEGIKKIFAYAKNLKMTESEFRSSGDTSALFSVTLESTTANGQTKTDNYFVRLSKNLAEEWKIESIELKEKQQINTKTQNR